MSTLNVFKWLPLAVVVSALVFTGCKKEDPKTEPTPAPIPAVTKQRLAFHLHTHYGPDEVQYGKVYTDPNGRKFDISKLQYYISNVRLIKADGSEMTVPNRYILVKPTEKTYFVDSVLPGDYKGFTFDVGIDSVTNHSDPALKSPTSPLSLESDGKDMHWSWTAGYIFVRLDAKVDSTPDKSAGPNKQIFLHLGNDANRRTINFSNSSFKVANSGESQIHIVADFKKYLDGVDLGTFPKLHGPSSVATKLANNLTRTFEVEDH
jgi:hypothetical protein